MSKNVFGQTVAAVALHVFNSLAIFFLIVGVLAEFPMSNFVGRFSRPVFGVNFHFCVMDIQHCRDRTVSFLHHRDDVKLIDCRRLEVRPRIP